MSYQLNIEPRWTISLFILFIVICFSSMMGYSQLISLKVEQLGHALFMNKMEIKTYDVLGGISTIPIRTFFTLVPILLLLCLIILRMAYEGHKHETNAKFLGLGLTIGGIIPTVCVSSIAFITHESYYNWLYGIYFLFAFIMIGSLWLRTPYLIGLILISSVIYLLLVFNINRGLCPRFNLNINNEILVDAKPKNLTTKTYWFPQSRKMEQLQKAQMKNIILHYADLSDIDFTGADMTDAVFGFEKSGYAPKDSIRHSLAQTSFKNTILKDVIFVDATLSYVEFAEATIDNTDFKGANLYQANFEDTNLENAKNFTIDLLDGKSVKFNENTQLPKTLLDAIQSNTRLYCSYLKKVPHHQAECGCK